MKEALIREFYANLEKGDGEAMGKLYHEDIHFEDPAFGPLDGEHAKNMWKMLCQNSNDIKVEVSDIKVDGDYASAKWVAEYAFSQTGNQVVNVIHAKYIFEGDKIIEHIDDFNLHTWAKQAMGTKGLLLGWTRFFQKKLWQQTHKMLFDFENKGK